MGKSYEFFKKSHPDQFSDSEIIRASKLDKKFFDYYLNTLTSRGEEKKFETFCRRIAEKEICPNLLPQTGPTGGGDSKVDSETYPISDQLPTIWYAGIGNAAAQERWAFAFSAKQKWKAKLYSDVEKIFAVNNEYERGYTKIYFISNQFISDRNRSHAEDELRQKYNKDIRVLDRNWLLEKVFTKGHSGIVVECFEMTDAFIDSVKKGPGDYTKELKLEELEDKLESFDPLLPKASMIPLALESAYISRSLELTKEITVSRFERALKIIDEFGLTIHKTECIYEWAWTLYWWYEDYSSFYVKYCEFEDLALSSGNIFEIERLSNLWINLRSFNLYENQKFNIELHSEKLLDVLNQYIQDQTKPHAAFEAKAIKLNISWLLEDDIENLDIEELIMQYIDLVNDSDNHLDFDLSRLAKILTTFPFFEDYKSYDDLFELLSSKLADRKQQITRAGLLIDRAIRQKGEKPIATISYIGRALIDLYKSESKHKLIIALSLLASSLEDIGCLWAARNHFLHLFALCFTQYTKYGEIHPALILSSNSLKMIELQIGRIGYALSSHEWSIISKNLYRVEVRENHLDNMPEDLFEPILAIAIMKTPFDKLDKISSLIEPLKKLDLYIAEVTAKYMLGHYDEEWLNYHENDISKFDDSMNQLYTQPANKQILYQPFYGVEEIALLQTKILGCNISIHTVNKFVCLELGATIFAMLEGFFATGASKRILVQCADINILLQHIQLDSFVIEIDENSDIDTDILIKCSDYDLHNNIVGQDQVAKFLQDLFPRILAKMVLFDASQDALDELIAEERAFDRAFSFTNSVFFAAQVLGDDYGTSIFNKESVSQAAAAYSLLRSSPVSFNTDVIERPIHDQSCDRKLKFIHGSPPDGLDFEHFNHQQLEIQSIINIPLWNKAKWRGVAVMDSPTHEFLPMFGLLFENTDIAQQIFLDWGKRFGKYDSADEIQIGIIKGIDKKNPFHYRVIVASNLRRHGNPAQIKRIQWICKLHTMEAKSLANLKILESVIKTNSQFQFLLYKIDHGQLEPLDELAIIKNVQSVTIRNAWEIEDDSYLLTGVMPTDNPIIPPSFEDAPILKNITYKTQLSFSKIGRNDPCPCGSGKKYKKCCFDKR